MEDEIKYGESKIWQPTMKLRWSQQNNPLNAQYRPGLIAILSRDTKSFSKCGSATPEKQNGEMLK